MKIIIEIPNHEFDNDVKDKFQDYFRRVGIDISHGTMCGRYERETTDMFKAYFKRMQVLPDNATNGDMIKALFPKEGFKLCSGFYENIDKRVGMDYYWWNKPYKGVEE